MTRFFVSVPIMNIKKSNKKFILEVITSKYGICSEYSTLKRCENIRDKIIDNTQNGKRVYFSGSLSNAKFSF